MFEALQKSFAEKASATEQDLQPLRQCFVAKRFKRRQLLLQEGDVCNRIAFIEKGAFYAYSLNEKGTSSVIQFGFEGWWIGDLYSFLTGEPSKLNVEALEDSEVLFVNRTDHNRLLKELPVYESYFRTLYQDAYVALQRRLEGTIGLTAEQKYERLLAQYSAPLTRVPLNLIAAYLGVTPETLSRIRGQQLHAGA